LTRRLALAVAGGLTVALSLPPWGWWPLSFAGIALFELALSPARGGAAPRGRRRAGLAFAFAFVWLMVATAWMWQLSAPGYVAANVVFGGYHAVAALIAPQGRWAVAGRPLAHALVEALRLSFPFGGVPLATLGIAQVAGPFAGLARVGGVILLTWFTFQLGFLAGASIEALRSRCPRRDAAGPLAWGLGGGAVALGLLVAAALAPRGHDTGDVLDVAAVQGGGEQGTRAGDVPSSLVTQRHLDATATIPADAGIDVVVWPENVVDVTTFAGSQEQADIAAQAERLGVPILVGITEDVADQPDRFTNAQVVVTPDGEVTGRYDKVRRVPFGEYVPLRGLLGALGAPVDQIGRDALAGTGPAYLDVPRVDGTSTRVAVVISWEVFFGGRAREGVSDGGELIVNPTNGASYTGTIVQSQQVASSRLRAIETGRWVVQVAPTGFSAFVTPAGRVIDRTAVSERAVIRHEVTLREGDTWYTRLGDGPWIVALLVAFITVDSAALNARRAR